MIMENAKILIYDGSFNGFLTAVYRAFETRIELTDIRRRADGQKAMFAEMVMVRTETDKARRVWDGIARNNYQAVRKIYFSFLSEQPGIEFLLYRYIRNLFKPAGITEKEAAISLRIDTLAEMVGQEKKRLEAGLKFSEANGSASLAVLSPRYNILPLITRHTRSRFPDRSWILYDNKRNYGLYFNREEMKLQKLNPSETRLLLQHDSTRQGTAILQQTPAFKSLTSKWNSTVPRDFSRSTAGKHMLAGSSAA